MEARLASRFCPSCHNAVALSLPLLTPLDVLHEMKVGHEISLRNQTDDRHAEGDISNLKHGIQTPVPRRRSGRIQQGGDGTNHGLGLNHLATHQRDPPLFHRCHRAHQAHLGPLQASLQLMDERFDPAFGTHHITLGEHAQGVAELGGRGLNRRSRKMPEKKG